jgi:RNA recognition motif-containing protein
VQTNKVRSTSAGGSGEANGKDIDEEQSSRVLWVGNIGSDVTEQELKEEFEQFGPLERVRILHDRFCAFVNFIIEEDAIAAKEGMQAQIVGSQYIVVNFRQSKLVPIYSLSLSSSRERAHPARSFHYTFMNFIIEEDAIAAKRACKDRMRG